MPKMTFMKKLTLIVDLTLVCLVIILIGTTAYFNHSVIQLSTKLAEAERALVEQSATTAEIVADETAQLSSEVQTLQQLLSDASTEHQLMLETNTTLLAANQLNTYKLASLESDLSVVRSQMSALQLKLDALYQLQLSYSASATQEYPIATYVYERLLDAGYTPDVACGILGNMMAECGTGIPALNLHATAINKAEDAYGICQWRKVYNLAVYGASLSEQVDYLLETLPSVFFSVTYEQFCAMSTSEAAKAFAINYERCSSASYEKRQLQALQAYNYFVRPILEEVS